MAIHEECGVFGILSRKRERLGKLVYYGTLCTSAQRAGKLRHCCK